jgi:hypothetical protein
MLKRPFVLNQSAFKDFNNCNRLYAWKRLQNLSPVGRAAALDIGTSVHAALATFHAATGKDRSVANAKEVARKKLTELAGAKKTFADMSLSEALDVAERIIPAYVAFWAGEEELWQPLNQEIKFLVEVGEETNVFLKGTADNLSVSKGGLYLVDYKTAGRMDPRDLLKYELDVQLTAYVYGLTKHLSLESMAKGGPPVFVRGAIIDVLVKTQIPQFARELFTRSVAELEEFEKEWVEICGRIRDQEDRVAAGEDWKTVFPKNTDSCFKYGRPCAFRDLCLSDTPTRRLLYDQRTPDYVDEAQAELDARGK